MTFYSQHGEDFLLHELFRGKKDGFFVEVGCIDGKRFSNTLFFEEQGWKGLCVEAHAGYIDLLKKNRPNSIICHCAAGESDVDGITFYANARGSLSTLDKSREEEWKRNYGSYFSGFEEQRIVKRRLDSLFREFGIQDIDILSLDIEGYEVEALKGIDLGRYRPAMFVIESDTGGHRRALNRILLPAGYHHIATLQENLFYALDRSVGTRIERRLFGDVRLIHTEHPLDHDGERVVTVDIDLRKRAVLKDTLMRLIKGN